MYKKKVGKEIKKFVNQNKKSKIDSIIKNDSIPSKFFRSSERKPVVFTSERLIDQYIKSPARTIESSSSYLSY